jgi:hypothetical protein
MTTRAGKAKHVHTVRLEDNGWRLILNLLNEELDVWENDSTTYAFVTVTIRTIEIQTGLRKKAAPDSLKDGEG